MSTATARTVSAPHWMLWTGRLLSFLVVAQLLSSAWFRATYHTYAVAEIVTGYGYPESAIVSIVIAECALVVLYLVPQTSVLAAIVMTGYLGGAVATHLRIEDTARAAIPLVVGILAWGGLYFGGTAASANWFPSAGRREWEFDEITSTRVAAETYAARTTSTKEKKSTSPPSRRWFAKRSPSTVLASRNLSKKGNRPRPNPRSAAW